MNVARAVVGANFGDEGKGLTTDYLVSKHRSDLVIRFNGGSQAGHTVMTPEGQRHVFSHFGAGSFSGARTLLPRFFIVNPMIYVREQLELALKFPECMDVLIDMDAPVTTPFDMIINQMAETKRGGNRHGSCGLGIGETIERTEKFGKISVRDLQNEAALTEKLRFIRNSWVSIRKKELELDDSMDNVIFSDALLEKYLQDVRFMLSHATLVKDVDVIKASKNPVFEGAQGLLLDQSHEHFPHVTRSNTGIKNVVVLAEEGGFKEIEVYYITRSYFTRHGAGPLQNELPRKPFAKIVDNTNITNEWQGSLRFAYLDTSLVAKTILSDLATNNTTIKVKPRLVVTCLDQLDGTCVVYHKGHENYLSNLHNRDIGDLIAQRIGFFGNHIKSFGPTRDNIVEYAEDANTQSLTVKPDMALIE